MRTERQRIYILLVWLKVRLNFSAITATASASLSIASSSIKNLVTIAQYLHVFLRLVLFLDTQAPSHYIHNPLVGFDIRRLIYQKFLSEIDEKIVRGGK